MLAHRVDEKRIPVPPAIEARLLGARRAAAMVTARRWSAMRNVFSILDEAGIPFVVLKGLALAHRVYPSPELRIMSDVDLWLGDGALKPAAAALERVGWHVPWWRRRDAPDSSPHASMALALGKTPLMMELHQQPASIAELIPSEIEAIWSRRIEVELAGSRTTALSDDDSLLHVCVHLAPHHRFLAALPRLLDVTLLLETRADDDGLTRFAARCRALKVAGWVAAGVGTAHRMLDAPITPSALDAFGVTGIDRVCEMAEEQSWLSDRAGVSPQSILAATSLGDRLARLGNRMRGVMAEPGETSAGAWQRTLLRIRFLAQIQLPAFTRAIRRGTFRGQEGARLQRLAQQNTDLMNTIRSAGASAQAALQE